MLTIVPLSPRVLNDFKAVRLRALKDTPSAFGRTYAEESNFSDAEWLNRVTIWNSGSRSVCYIAMNGGEPCGIIACYLDDHDPPRPNVASMWVAPSHRRSGLGTRLLDYARKWAQTLKTPQMRLMVTSGNAAAIHFYERYGFALTGTIEPYPPNPTLHQCEMTVPLDTPWWHDGV
jgi:ribosomal protein S18 acetylase RimI-like enzyme